MSRRVFLHVGLPKTGTSYLQSILWAHRDELRAAGVLLPGRERRDHLWASLVVRGDPSVARRGARAPSSWRVLQEAVAQWDGDSVISHEFFCSASTDQARAMVAALAPAQVHLVVTAREPLSLFTSSWQEHLKNKGTTRIEDYAKTVSQNPTDVWNWRALDLSLVLERWGDLVTPERVHVVTMPAKGDPPDELWRRFCGVIGTDPGVATQSAGFRNSSMGVVEAETLRRLNLELTGFDSAIDRGVWIRSFLADDRLAPRDGERFWPSAERVEDCRRRGAAAVEMVRREGYDVVGDLTSLEVPAQLDDRRHPDSVTDEEVAAVAISLVGVLLGDVRRLSARSQLGGSSSRKPLSLRLLTRLRRSR